MGSSVTTRFLVLSDTHGEELDLPDCEVDVALHCGDLTEESKLDEFKTALRLLKKVEAPLKLVVVGNHDFTLDTPTFKAKLNGMNQDIEEDLVRRIYGGLGEARALFESEDGKASGIVFLDEGTHHFKLANGAALTVYASPYTPSLSDWGFQYHPEQGHDWHIASEVDVAVTHGPPLGILDYTDSKKRAGSASLFSAVARARPKLHCFGHIHEGWGAKKVTWRPVVDDNPSHFTAIDNDQSETVETLATIRPKKFDTDEILREKEIKCGKLIKREYCLASGRLESGKQTFFVNAAIQGGLDYPLQVPWRVDIDLLRCVSSR